MEKLDIVLLLTIGLGLAGLFGYLARRCRLPPILGYLFAGYLIGPYSPGYVADLTLTEQLGEIGIVLMLFAVGLHFKLEDLMAVKKIAIPGAVIQTLVTTIVTTGLLYLYGWTLVSGILIGASIGVASTVVLLRLLADNRMLHTKEGHIAIGWLIVEDIFTVFFLILLPSLALSNIGADLPLWKDIGLVLFALLKFTLLVLLIFTIGQKIVVKILTSVARLRSEELFILTVLALMFIVATGSAVVFGTSIALGAFIAGMLIGKTSVRHQATANALPMKDVFAVIFFLTVGMLFNPLVIWDHFFLFMSIVLIILIIKPIAAYVTTRALGYSYKVALSIALALSQIGEFSFILAEQAMNLKLMPDEGFDLLVAAAIVTISLNPLLFTLVNPLYKAISRYKHPAGKLTEDKTETIKIPFPLSLVIIGFGPVGKMAARVAKEAGYHPVIIENNIDTVSDLEGDYEILFGDATEPTVLKQARLGQVRYLIVTIPETAKAISIIDAARRINPGVIVLTRVHYITDIPQIQELNVHYVCSEEALVKEFRALLESVVRV